MKSILIFLLAAPAATGQTGTASIQGTVTDAKTKQPIPAALVMAIVTAESSQASITHVDALGSTRLVTNETGAVTSRHDYAPFGGELGLATNAGVRIAASGFVGQESGVREEFTGKERDAESGLDYVGTLPDGSATTRFRDMAAAVLGRFDAGTRRGVGA